VKTALLGALFLLAGTAAAQAAPAEMGCRTLLDDAVIARCVGDLHDTEAALTAVMRRLLLNVPPADRAPLRKAERVWRAYRDAQCAYETRGKGADAMEECLTALSKARIKQLTLIAVR
jgi:uncharacterized protein YecT (DUF1311 family)